MDADGADSVRAPLLGGAASLLPDSAEADGGLFLGPERMEYPFLDESLLQELRSIHEHDVEAGGAGAAAPEELPHADDEVFKMRELIDEKPEDVLHYIEEQGVLKVCEFEVQDSLAFKAFQAEGILTMGADHFEVEWEELWRERLADTGKAAGAGWTTSVLLEAHVVNLRDAAAQGSKGLLQPLLKRYQAGGCSMAVFALPAVQAVIHYKWTAWARRFLLYELAAYCCWLLAFTAFTLLFQQEDWSLGFWATIRNPYGLGATVCSALCVAAMLPFLYMETCTVIAYSAGWAASPWNILDMLSYILQVAISALHSQRGFVDEGWYSVMIATQHVLMWTKLQYFARVFNPTKTTFIDTIRLVMEDMKWFLLFLLMTMVGFGMAFYALYRQDRDDFQDFANIWHALASMFSYLLAMFDYNVFYNSTNPTAAMILFIIFEFVMNVMMLNIMIASMTNSFSKVTQDEGLRFLASKAEIIDELEATLPGWLKARAWFPPFIHILKFHPDSTYEVNLNSLWSGIGLMETNLLNAQEETRRRVEDMEERTLRVHRKLDVLIKMIIGLHPPQQLAAIHRQATRANGGGAAGGARLRGGAAAAGLGHASRAYHHSSSAPWAGGGAAGADGGGPGGRTGSGSAAAAGGGGAGRAGSGTAGGLADQLERVSGPLLHAATSGGALPLQGGPSLQHWAALGHLPGGGGGGGHGGYGHPYAAYGHATGGGYFPYWPYGPPPGGAPYAGHSHSPPAGGGYGGWGGPWGGAWGGGWGGRASASGGPGLSPAASLGRRPSDSHLGSAAHLPSVATGAAGGGSGGGERGEQAGGSRGASRSATPVADGGGGAAQSPFASVAANRGAGAAGAAARPRPAARRSWGQHPPAPPHHLPPHMLWPPPYALPMPIPGPRGHPAAPWGAHPMGGHSGGVPHLSARDVLPHSV
ncbi:MAG: hypothetical protein J3K34DRAFT_518899 [Monoraphidium minutum]|nr:MAG: hypothetical protein J3K34DRAFT_518899 [Monoraphidium minutum]